MTLNFIFGCNFFSGDDNDMAHF